MEFWVGFAAALAALVGLAVLIYGWKKVRTWLQQRAVEAEAAARAQFEKTASPLIGRVSQVETDIANIKAKVGL